ncbi:hypothetical protein P9112_001827 [Eukaryota sp. TZLM1-RC]
MVNQQVKDQRSPCYDTIPPLKHHRQDCSSPPSNYYTDSPVCDESNLCSRGIPSLQPSSVSSHIPSSTTMDTSSSTEFSLRFPLHNSINPHSLSHLISHASSNTIRHESSTGSRFGDIPTSPIPDRLKRIVGVKLISVGKDHTLLLVGDVMFLAKFFMANLNQSNFQSNYPYTVL